MVDVGSKDTTRRMARAVAVVDIGEIAYKLVANNQVIVKEIRAASKLLDILDEFMMIEKLFLARYQKEML